MNVAPTSVTPALVYTADSGTLDITGESYPENSFEFYRPLLAWLDQRLATRERLVVRMRVTYMNTSTVKCIMDLFDRLDEASQGGAEVEVVWIHAPGDERTRELGEEFKEDLSLPFTLREES